MPRYNEAVASKVATPQGIILFILQGYQASEDFRSLAESTRRSYVPLIKRIEKDFGDFPLAALTDRRTRGAFLAWRDKIAASSGRRQADYAWSVLARVLSWSLNRGLVAANPCTHGGRLYSESRAEKSGPRPTRRRSSNARPRICIHRYCWGCGPASGKAICWASPGRPMTGHTSGCANPRPDDAFKFESVRRSKPPSTR